MPDNATVQSQSSWKIRLDPTVNFGHVMTATVFLVTAAAGWATLDAKQTRAEERVARLERLEEELRRDRTREIERFASMDANLTTVKQVIERMDRQVNTLFTERRRVEYERP